MYENESRRLEGDTWEGSHHLFHSSGRNREQKPCSQNLYSSYCVVPSSHSAQQSGWSNTAINSDDFTSWRFPTAGLVLTDLVYIPNIPNTGTHEVWADLLRKALWRSRCNTKVCLRWQIRRGECLGHEQEEKSENEPQRTAELRMCRWLVPYSDCESTVHYGNQESTTSRSQVNESWYKMVSFLWLLRGSYSAKERHASQPAAPVPGPSRWALVSMGCATNAQPPGQVLKAQESGKQS